MGLRIIRVFHNEAICQAGQWLGSGKVLGHNSVHEVDGPEKVK